MGMKSCKKCIYYDGRRWCKSGLGFCRRYNKLVSPYELCGEFNRKGL